MAWRRALVVAAVAFLTLLASCGGSREPPYGLGSVDLPEGSEEIASVLATMPQDLQGNAASPLGAEGHMVRLSYGDEQDLSIVATDFGAGSGDFPAWTVEEFLPRFADSGEMEVEGSDLSGPLLYLTGQNSSVSEGGQVEQTFWTMWFGAPSSMWVFSVSAPTEEDGIALVDAFVEAAS